MAAVPGPRIKWGTLEIPCEWVYPEMTVQEPPSIRQGATRRADREGTRSVVLANASQGLGVIRGREQRDINNVGQSELTTHIFESLYLPYVVQTQTSITGNNLTANRDTSSGGSANRRIHAALTTLGQQKLRPYFGIGRALYRSVSDTDHSIESAASAYTDQITCIFEGRFNNTRYLVTGTDGVTNDVVGWSDPVALSNTAIFALSAGDIVCGGAYLKGLGSGYNIFYGKIGGVTGFHYLNATSALLTAPTPVVLTANKDIEGTIATVTTSAVTASSGGAEGGSGDTRRPEETTAENNNTTSSIAYWSAWTTPSEATGAADNAYASATFNARVTHGTYTDPGVGAPTTNSPSNLLSDVLVLSDYDFSSIPDAAIITGLKGQPEAKEGDAGDNILWAKFQFLVNGGEVGMNLASGEELTNSDATYTFGSNTNRAGTNLRGKDIKRSLGVAMQFMATEVASNSSEGTSSTASGTVTVDACPVTITYRMPGTLATIPLGGYFLGPDPLDPNTIYIVAPEFQDDTGTTNVPRILWKATFEYDQEGDRPTVTLAKVPTLMNHIEAACFSLGRVVVAGDTSGGVAGKVVRAISTDGQIQELGFGYGQGFKNPTSVVNLWDAGQYVVAQVTRDDTTKMQFLAYTNKTWHAISKEVDIVGEPLRYAENPIINPTLLRYYSFRPNVSPVNLIAEWPMNEASGNRVDAYSLYTLTDNNTVTRANGPGGDFNWAAQFTSANSEYLNAIDSAGLSTGDVDFAISFWAYLDTKAADMFAVSKWTSGGNQREYQIAYDQSDDRFIFVVSADGTSGTAATVTANNFGSPSTATWYFIIVWHDASANTINIQVNNGTVNSTSHSTGVFNSTSDFYVGATNSGGVTGYWNGRITGLRYWERVPTSAERTLLYNSGTPASTTIDRQFRPRSLSLDPIRNNTTETKEDGPLSAVWPEMDILGPEEANKAVYVAWNFSRDVSASNTIKLEYSVDGPDGSFSTWTTFTAFGARSALSTPAVQRTLTPKITLNHTASSAGTPNGLPIVIEGSARYREARKWQVIIDPSRQDFKDERGTVADLWDSLKALADANPLQTLSIGQVTDRKARWVGFQAAEYPPTTLGNDSRNSNRGQGPASPFLDTRTKIWFEEAGA